MDPQVQRMVEQRPTVDVTKGTLKVIAGIGSRHGLTTAEAYGAALNYAEYDREGFEEYLETQGYGDDENEDDDGGEGGSLEADLEGATDIDIE